VGYKSRFESRETRNTLRDVSSSATTTWVFLTNHAHVLLCVARDPQARARDIAESVGITERATQRILSELIAEGYLTRIKVGRRNRYTVNRRGHLRHPIFQEFEIGPLIDLLQLDAPGEAGLRQRALTDGVPAS
jgi:hypothetical protein